MIEINWKHIISTFIPIFVAMGPLGNMLVFISLTEGFQKPQKQRIIRTALITALLVVIIFLLVGKSIFILLGITISDFMVAGGTLLLIIAINILLSVEMVKSASQKEVGAVPLGTPMIAGPAVLTTSLILIDIYGITSTIIALILSIVLTGIIFVNASYITKKIGVGGTKALSKITAIFLAAIAVMMIRRGIVEIIKSSL